MRRSARRALRPSFHRSAPRVVRGIVMALALLAVSCAGAAATEGPRLEPFQLEEASYAAWRDYLRPTPEESAWSRIPWRISFADGLRDAAAEGKPLLLWGMNGHPLGAT